jgi:histidyl-tRNA synthetase
LADAEAIAAGHHIQRELGIADGVVLEVNTLGDAESRDAYRAALVAYFSEHREALSEDSQRRLDKNPLRIIDSKDAKDRALVAHAPTIEALPDGQRPCSLGRSAPPPQELRRRLQCEPAHRPRPRLLQPHRFEFVTDRLGAQGTVMGGGRYDGLVEEMGGPPTPSVGWAGGIERLAMLLKQGGNLPPAERPIHVIPVTEAEEAQALAILQALRTAGLAAEMTYRGNLKRRMERANKVKAPFVVILGEEELVRNVVRVRDLDNARQYDVKLPGSRAFDTLAGMFRVAVSKLARIGLGKAFMRPI